MEDHYGIADLRQYIASSRPLFPHPSPDLLSAHRPPYYDGMLMFRSDSSSSVAAPPGTCLIGFETGMSIGGNGASDGAAGRWPRQETLTLLEIRSRLDHKFKEANQKGPLWDEVSRIMSEEHGYQRSGKKCREKFENLYKYYKKTKDGKAGRQDGKHYRFFRQLEALYGDSNSAASTSDQAYLLSGNFHYDFPNKCSSLAVNQDSFQGAKLSDTSLSLSNYSDADTSSSDNSDLNEGIDDDNDLKNKKRGKRSWKVKIRDFIDLQMKKLMDKQEAWMEKMVKTMEQKEQERMLREEEWRKQDAARVEKEQKFWADERAWIEARDAALMEALHKITGKDKLLAGDIHSQNDDGSDQTMHNNSAKGGDIWLECEVTRLIQLRTSMEAKFQQRVGGVSEEMLWEEIASKMACLGHDRTGPMCKNKWESVNNYLLKCSKKRKENSTYYPRQDQGMGGGDVVYSSCETSDRTLRLNDHANSSPNTNTNTGNVMNDNCLRYLVGDAYGRIMD